MTLADWDEVIALWCQSEGTVLGESDSSECIEQFLIAHRPFVRRKFCTNRRVVSLQTSSSKALDLR